MIKVNVRNWNIMPKDDPINTLYLIEMLDNYRSITNIEFLFERGTYHFYPDYAVEKLLYISNHDDDTIKKIAFDLTNFCDAIIRGNETVFIFHTEIIPFYLHNCKNINISGIIIDYKRPAYSEGEICSIEPNRMEVYIDKTIYPYYILHNRIYFTGENFRNELDYGCLEMDQNRNAPAYNVHDISFNLPYKNSYSAIFREVGENKVEILLTDDQSFSPLSKAGNKLIFRHHLRTHPAFYITYSKDITCKTLKIFHCTGMGVIAQFSENISLNKFDICIDPEHKRSFTAIADGFHFVYCKGKIQIKDCLVENQLDDPVNIHGIYGRIHKILNENVAIVELVEGMHKGVVLGKKGDRFAILNNKTMIEEEINKAVEVEQINKDYLKIHFEKTIASYHEGYVIENKEFISDVCIEGCIFRNNRARGILLTSGGEVIVRNNIFQNAGAAILIEGDSNYWFESGATQKIIVENNKFINCAYVSDWGLAPIQVSPSAEIFQKEKYYHKYLEIKENVFWCFDERLVFAKNIETLVLENNIIHKTDEFPGFLGEELQTKHVGEVRMKNNWRIENEAEN